jgi:SNF2 family DNA or RNA helicase
LYRYTPVLQALQWNALIVDEGHSLKAGPGTKRFETMKRLKSNHRVLLTVGGCTKLNTVYP